jgi:predicted nucleic acid-binding protein
VIDAEGPRFAWNDITSLAETFGLTIYDATYLELAIRRGLPLALRDTSLNDAARLRGVKTES